MEERLKVSKEFSNKILSWMRGRGEIIIIVHDNPDPDCLASALALSHLFLTKLGQKSVIALSGMIGRSENIAMARGLQIGLTPLSIINFKEFKTVCMLDTQPMTGNNSLPQDVTVDIVIDHHPLREATKMCKWVDVRENYGATSTIVYEYLLAQDIKITTKIATALFYAIKSETQDLGREANHPDKTAYLHLFPLTNKKLLYQITNPRQPMEYYRTIRRTLDNARIYDSVMVANMGKIAFPEVVAEMADFLLHLEGMDSVLCTGEYNNSIIISLRTMKEDFNAGDALRRIVDVKGVAGGHGMMAGGKIDLPTNSESAISEAEKFITTRFLEETDSIDAEPKSFSD
ncbi:MAG: DHH family phosphoesterase [Desulfuromonadales bacterium]|nr:DHH family phosphoesterase [Desulfuromonadales bacterium]